MLKLVLMSLIYLFTSRESFSNQNKKNLSVYNRNDTTLPPNQTAAYDMTYLEVCYKWQYLRRQKICIYFYIVYLVAVMKTGVHRVS